MPGPAIVCTNYYKIQTMREIKRIIVKSGKDQSLRRLHPWLFSGAIKKMSGTPRDGELVKVYDNKNEFLALGHYQIGSIAVRVISFSDFDPDENFWMEKIRSVYEYRKMLGFFDSEETSVFRFINAEGDGMPGLIADFYNGTLVVQFHSVGMYLIRDMLVEIFKRLLGDKLKAIYYKSGKTLPHKADIDHKDAWLFGEDNGRVVKEYGNSFKIDFEKGQKTGFFIDQRENRKLVEKYSKDKKVLNLFGYSGAFSVYAMRGGAEQVHTVDSSAIAIELAKENLELNFPGDKRHDAIVADAFNYLDSAGDKGYDLIILDPPAFAKHQNVLHKALQGYKRLNAKAFQCIRPGGILFTFSCSQAVSRENFKRSVFVAAANSGRSVRILYQLSQPVDHPVSIYHPEGEYLKGLVLYVE